MRSLRPNSRGIIVPTKQPRLSSVGDVHPLKVPSRTLHQIDKMRNGETPNMLIIRSQGGIGDVLMTTPTVKAIAKKYDCQVTYATNMGYLDGALQKVLQGNPYIKKIVNFREVDSTLFDGVVNLSCPCIVHEKPLAPPINRIDLFARHAGIPLSDTSIDYYPTKDELQWAKNYLEDRGLSNYKILFVQPSSSASHRDAPVEKMKHSVANILSLQKDIRAIVITHDSDNKRSDWNINGVTICNNEDCRNIAALMYYSNLVLCPDSAILHLASALKKKTITLFGPTDPYARVNYHPEAIAIWPGKELKNYPCWYNDPQDGYICWKRLDQDVITECCLAHLNDLPLPMSRDLVTVGEYQYANKFYQTL